MELLGIVAVVVSGCNVGSCVCWVELSVDRVAVACGVDSVDVVGSSVDCCVDSCVASCVDSCVASCVDSCVDSCVGSCVGSGVVETVVDCGVLAVGVDVVSVDGRIVVAGALVVTEREDMQYTVMSVVL